MFNSYKIILFLILFCPIFIFANEKEEVSINDSSAAKRKLNFEKVLFQKDGVTFSADKLEINLETETLTFSGNVKIENPHTNFIVESQSSEINFFDSLLKSSGNISIQIDL